MTYLTPNQRSIKRRYIIGIDPDKDKSGFAVYDRVTKTWLDHKALGFAALQEACFGFEKETCEVFVEAGWLNKGMNDYQSKTLPKDFAKWNRARREAYIFERGCDVGVNFGAGFAIMHVLKANGYQVKPYCPKTPKWDAAWLQRYTGITARTNQDTRDAIRAAFLNR